MQKGNIIISAFIFLAATIQAQEIRFPELKGFKIHTDYPVYVRDNLWDFIDGAADAYLALGFVDLHIAEYKKGKNVIKVEIYRHSDPIMTFGIYASERSPSFRFMDIGAQGYFTDGAINFFKGDYYVKLRTYSKNGKIIQAEESLADDIANMLEGKSEMPPALSMFPSEGRKINEETFINENVLGHSFLNHAFKAQYGNGSADFSIYIIEKQTPEETREMVEKYLALSGISTADGLKDKYVLKDGFNGTIYLARKGKNVVLIQGLAEDQKDIAEKYITGILE